MRQSTIVISVLGLIVLMAMFVSCGGTKASPTPSPSLSAADIISQSSAKMQALNSYHFLLDQVGGGTPVGMGVEMTKAEGDVVRPDKLKATLTGTAVGITLQIQLVSVGGVLKMTNPLSGKWETPPAAFNVLSLFDPNTGVAAIMKGLTNVIRLEDAEAGGVLCYHLSGSINSEDLKAIAGSSAPGVTIQAEVWIGKVDLLLREVKLTGKITESEVEGIVRTLKLSNFDQPVTIELPQ